MDLALDGRYRGIIDLIGVDPKLDAGEAFRFDEVQIRFGVHGLDAEPGFPINPLALRLHGSGSRQRCKNSTTSDSHCTDDTARWASAATVFNAWMRRQRHRKGPARQFGRGT